MSSSWAVRRKDNGKYYRGGWLWRWTRFACFAARYANPTATMQFFIPLLEKQGVEAQVVWLRSRVRERELDRYRQNLQDEQRRIGRGGAFITGQIAAALAGGSIAVSEDVLSAETAIGLAGAGEDGFDRHIAPPGFTPATSEEWKAVEDHTGLTTVGPESRPAIEIRWGGDVAYIPVGEVEEKDRDLILYNLREFVEFLLKLEKDRVATPLEAWQRVSIDANKTLDAYLREVCPDLPEHYGMPVDGVRRVVEFVRGETGKSKVGVIRDPVDAYLAGRDDGKANSIISEAALDELIRTTIEDTREACAKVAETHCQGIVARDIRALQADQIYRPRIPKSVAVGA